MKKKIGLYIKIRPEGGGTYQYNLSMLEALNNLPSQDFDKVIVYIYDLWESHLQRERTPSIKVKPGLLGRAFGIAWQILGLPIELLRKFSPAVYPVTRAMLSQNCHLWIFPSQDSFYTIPVPALGTIHDLMHRYAREFPEFSSRGKYRRKEMHYKRICDWGKGVIVDSNIGKQQVMECYGVKPQKIHILPFVPPEYIQEKTHLKLTSSIDGLPKKFFFYPAQFWKHKNHILLVKAFRRLKEKLPDLKMVFSGSEKNAYRETRNAVNQLGLANDIIFLGFVPNDMMPELYKRARGLIMPTFAGPTNIPPLEANVLGCPVAISNIYGMPDQLGDAALYFNPSSIEEIAKSMERLWKDEELCADLRKKGLDRANLWTQEHFNKKFCSIIRSTIE